MILSAVPKGLRLDVEIREIEEAIRYSLKRDHFAIKVRTAIRPRDFRRIIAEEKPYIVHFCGHGLENGDLLLEDNNSRPQAVTPSALAQLFELHSKYVHCVVLNACYSESTAKAISNHIQYVIGMNQAINDKSAIVFSQGFYDALGYENQDSYQEIERAFEEGKIAIQMEGARGSQTPILKRRFSVPISSYPPFFSGQPKISEQIPPSYNRSCICNYQKLRQCLEKEDFKEADKETFRIFLTLVNRIEEGWLRVDDIVNFPCPDFRILNHLWLNFSGGRFGFSVQRDIWLSLGVASDHFSGQHFREFSNRVGWRSENNWISYDMFDFSKSAPYGHLPSIHFFDQKQSMNSLSIWKDSFKGFLSLSEKYLSH